MSAQDNLSLDQFGYHVSAHPFKTGDKVIPGGGPRNYDESSSRHAYFTQSQDRAEYYHYHLWEKGIRGHHIYEVSPTGPYETDPGDEESFRSTKPLHVWGRLDAEYDE